MPGKQLRYEPRRSSLPLECPLTEREFDLALRLIAGQRLAQVAHEWDVTLATVTDTARRLRRRLDAATSEQAVVVFIRQGWARCVEGPQPRLEAWAKAYIAEFDRLLAGDEDAWDLMGQALYGMGYVRKRTAQADAGLDRLIGVLLGDKSRAA